MLSPLLQVDGIIFGGVSISIVFAAVAAITLLTPY